MALKKTIAILLILFLVAPSLAANVTQQIPVNNPSGSPSTIADIWNWIFNHPASGGSQGPQGINGTPGICIGNCSGSGGNGTIIYNGAGTPDILLGINGDYYLDTASSDLYNKTSGVWAARFSLAGQMNQTMNQTQGLQGNPGANGAPGPNVVNSSTNSSFNGVVCANGLNTYQCVNLLDTSYATSGDIALAINTAILAANYNETSVLNQAIVASNANITSGDTLTLNTAITAANANDTTTLNNAILGANANDTTTANSVLNTVGGWIINNNSADINTAILAANNNDTTTQNSILSTISGWFTSNNSATLSTVNGWITNNDTATLSIVNGWITNNNSATLNSAIVASSANDTFTLPADVVRNPETVTNRNLAAYNGTGTYINDSGYSVSSIQAGAVNTAILASNANDTTTQNSVLNTISGWFTSNNSATLSTVNSWISTNNSADINTAILAAAANDTTTQNSVLSTISGWFTSNNSATLSTINGWITNNNSADINTAILAANANDTTTQNSVLNTISGWFTTNNSATLSTVNGWISNNNSVDINTALAATKTNRTIAANFTVYAQSLIPEATSGATEVAPNTSGMTNGENWVSLDFPSGSVTYAQIGYVMPPMWDGGNVYATFYLTDTGGSGTVIMGWQGVCMASGDALNTAFGTAQTVTTTMGAINTETISAESPATTFGGTTGASNYCFIRVYRPASGGTLATSASLLAVRVRYGTI